MRKLVTDEEISRYQRDGVIMLKNLFDTRWLDILSEGIEDNLHNPSKRTTHYVNDPAKDEHFFFDALVRGEISAYDRLMLESPMAESVARLMGSSQAILFYISVFIRSAGTPHTDALAPGPEILVSIGESDVQHVDVTGSGSPGNRAGIRTRLAPVGV